MNLVVFKFVQLGDNVVFLPVIQALRARFPDWRVTVLTTPREAELYAASIAPREILTAPQLRFNSSWKRPWEFVRWWSRVRDRHPDICLVSFDQGNAAHLVAKWSGAPIRIGAKLPHVRIAGSLTHDVPLPRDERVPTWHWEMARTVAQVASGSAAEWPAFPPPPDLRHMLQAIEPASRSRIVIHAGSNQPVTRWPLDRFAAIAGRLARDHEVVWIERPETAETTLAPDVRRHTPRTLSEFASLLASADLFLGNNSGPMHLANALGCFGVAVTGPSAFAWDPYWFRDRWRVLRHPTLPCAPCEWAENFVHDCALTSDRLACLRYWTVDAVEQHCREMLTTRQTG